MDTDEKIRMAKRLAEEFTGVDHNELSKWTEYLKRYNIDKGITLANYLSMSPMLRPLPRGGYNRICAIMDRKRAEFENIEHKDLIELLGYVRWRLIGARISLKGAWKKSKVTKKDIKEVKKHGIRGYR
jgi:hypothetical protein